MNFGQIVDSGISVTTGLRGGALVIAQFRLDNNPEELFAACERARVERLVTAGEMFRKAFAESELCQSYCRTADRLLALLHESKANEARRLRLRADYVQAVRDGKVTEDLAQFSEADSVSEANKEAQALVAKDLLDLKGKVIESWSLNLEKYRAQLKVVLEGELAKARAAFWDLPGREGVQRLFVCQELVGEVSGRSTKGDPIGGPGWGQNTKAELAASELLQHARLDKRAAAQKTGAPVDGFDIERDRHAWSAAEQESMDSYTKQTATR